MLNWTNRSVELFLSSLSLFVLPTVVAVLAKTNAGLEIAYGLWVRKNKEEKKNREAESLFQSDSSFAIET